jgi:DNA replication and repair protein RecF
MLLHQLSLINFKNYRDASFTLDAKVNIFTGLNGQGKTNILDAVHYLSFCKSYFNPIDSQNIRHGEDFFVVEGRFLYEDQTDKVYCGVKRGQKKVFKKNKEEYDRLASHIGQYPAVIISPYDKDLISEGSELRRKFVDSIISQFNRPYLDALIQYGKVLRQRNSLLKYFRENRTFDEEGLELWTRQMIELGRNIHERRKDFIEDLRPLFLKHYSEISGDAESVDLVYKSHFFDADIADLYRQNLQKDLRTAYSNIGIHKDDISFEIDGHPLKKFGSQGQQKTFLISLKLAQFDLVKEATGKVPILLLDDIFDKIDDVRVAHLMKLVSDDCFGQILITDTHAERIEDMFKRVNSSRKIFKVKEGAIYEP